MKDHTPVLKVEGGVVVGNVYDKYGTGNPVARHLMRRFLGAFSELAESTGATRAHEVGCGEGHLAVLLASLVKEVRASDYSARIVAEARERAAAAGAKVDFRVADLYHLDPDAHSSELVVCCEVLEHLAHPQKALAILASMARPWLLVSVPWEPVWRILNIARGKYVAALGNTPGHANHWSRSGFLRFLRSRVDVVEVRRPFPWTMALCRSESRG